MSKYCSEIIIADHRSVLVKADPLVKFNHLLLIIVYRYLTSVEMVDLYRQANVSIWRIGLQNYSVVDLYLLISYLKNKWTFILDWLVYLKADH